MTSVDEHGRPEHRRAALHRPSSPHPRTRLRRRLRAREPRAPRRAAAHAGPARPAAPAAAGARPRRPAARPTTSPTAPVARTPSGAAQPAPGPHPAAPQPPGARPAHGARSRPTDASPHQARRRRRAQPRGGAAGQPVQHPPVRYHGPTPDEVRLDAAGRTRFRRFSTLGPALLTTLLSTLLPGAGHLLSRRYRTGAAIIAAFVLGLLTLLVLTRAGGPVGPDGHAALVAHPGRRRDRPARRRARLDGGHRPHVRCSPARPACAPGSACSAIGVVTALCLVGRRPAGLRRRARQLPAPAARPAVPVAGRRHPGRRGDRQGAAERPAGRQRRRAGPAAARARTR